MPIPAQANYNPPRINRYVPGMKYDANVGADGLTRIYFGALTNASNTAVQSAIQMVNGSAVTINYGPTSGIVGGAGAPFGRVLRFAASSTNTRAVTVEAVDYLGQPYVETVTLTSATAVFSKKAAYKVNKLTFASASDTTTVDVGTGNRFGVPYALAKGALELIDGVGQSLNSDPVQIPWELEQTQLLAPTNEVLVSPVRGYITKLSSVVQAAVTTGGDITVLSGATTVTGLTTTIADGATAGTVVTDTPTDPYGSTGLVAVGGSISIVPGSPFASAGEVNGIVEVTPVGLIPRTNTQSLTAYDPRGLYEPTSTPDGTKIFELTAHVDINNTNGFHGTAHVVS